MTVLTAIQGKLIQSLLSGWDEKSEPSAETNLIERAKSDPEAFGHLYEIHYSAILNYIYHRTFNVAIAEDLTSNTFFNALKALPKFHPRAPFRAWLYRIAANEVRAHFRKRTRRQTFEKQYQEKEDLESVYFPPMHFDAEPDTFTEMERYRTLHAALILLPDKYQNVLTLRYFENLSYQAIAEALGKREGTIKSLVHRGLKRMRKILEKENATSLPNRH